MTGILKGSAAAIFIAGIFSCAQVVRPTGGPKDKTAPVVEKYIPDSASTNFKSKEINIFFNEYIQLKDINNQLIISPPLKRTPDIEANNKQLRIKLSDTLEENTTYTINFGNSISDITEGNVKENFQYVFSTGNFIDSISFSGKVQYAFNKKTEKGILVMLYKSMGDSLPYKRPPSYFTKTKENGTFRINNITGGKYKLFALKDSDNNYLFNSKDEAIGFSDTLINLFTSSSGNIFLFKETPKQFLKKALYAQFGKINLIFNKSAEDIKLEYLRGNPSDFLKEYSSQKDTLHIWYTGKEELVKIKVWDNDFLPDTAEIKMISKEKAMNNSRGAKPGLSASFNATESNPLNIGSSFIIEFSNPVKEADLTKIKLTQKTDTLKIAPVFIDSTRRKLAFKYTFTEDSSYSISVLPGVVKDIFGFTNDTIKAAFKVQKEKFYGSLRLDLEIPLTADNYILQLIDEKENVIRESFVKGSALINYEHILPGRYRLKIIYDDNSNNKWDTGNYLKKQQPEKVTYFSTPLTIRSNWDMEEKWKAE